MKICRSCGNECQDIDAFCSKCGAKLETEIKCANCGKVLAEDDKFCPACGTKVGEPVVVDKPVEPKKEEPERNTRVQEIVKKVLFFAIGGSLLFFLFLMFIGCFGEIITTNYMDYYASSGGLSSSSSIGVNYFFGDAIKQINKIYEESGNNGYRFFSFMVLIIEYIAWLGAIAVIVVGIAVGATALAKGKKKNYELNAKMYLLTLLSPLPYLFMFSTKYFLNANYSRIYSRTTSYGWGAIMIFVFMVLGILLLVAYKILKAVFEKQGALSVIKVAINIAVGFGLFIALITTTGPSILFSGKSVNFNNSGTMSVYSLFTEELLEHPQNIPNYATLALFGTIFIYIGVIFALCVVYKMFSNKKNKVALIVYTAFTSAILLAGYIMSVVSCYQASTGDSLNEVSISFAPGAYAVILFLIFATVAYCVTYNFDTKKPNQIAQQ